MEAILCIPLILAFLMYLFAFFTMNVIERGLVTAIVAMIATIVMSDISHARMVATHAARPVELATWVRLLPLTIPLAAETLRAIATRVLRPASMRPSADTPTVVCATSDAP